MKILSEKIEVLQRYPQKSILAIFQMFTLVADIYEHVQEAKKHEPKKTERDMVQQIVKELKRGKARDCQDWN